MTKSASYAIAFALFTLAGVLLHIETIAFHGLALAPFWWVAFLSLPAIFLGVLGVAVLADHWKRYGMYKAEFYILTLTFVVGVVALFTVHGA